MKKKAVAKGPNKYGHYPDEFGRFPDKNGKYALPLKLENVGAASIADSGIVIFRFQGEYSNRTRQIGNRMVDCYNACTGIAEPEAIPSVVVWLKDYLKSGATEDRAQLLLALARLEGKTK